MSNGSERPPLVSVITPCYNAAAFVGGTLASVAAQAGPALEHIVVDDGSTDGSWAVIAAAAAAPGARVRAVRLAANRGGAHARNAGAARARGAYLMFLDADDVLAPGTLSALAAALRDETAVAAVCSWHRLRQRRGAWRVEQRDIPFPPPPDPLLGWLTGTWVPPCAVLWQRDAYERTGGWDEMLTLDDDGDLMMRALARGVRLVVARGGESYYRWYGETRLSVSRNVFSERKLQSQRRVLDKIAAELDGQSRLAPYRDALGVRYQRLALLAFQHGFAEFGRDCLRIGLSYGPRRAVSRTWIGRMLDVVLGLERKEQLANVLATVGIMTLKRRRKARLRRHTTGDAGPAAAPRGG